MSRTLVCLLAICAAAAMLAASPAVLAAKAPATTGGTGATTGGTNLLESGGAGTSSGEGSEEGEGEEGTEASKSKGTTGSSDEESNAFGSLPILFGMGGAAVLIAAIAIFVLRDARKNAPVPEGGIAGATTRMSPDQMRKRRSKAKAVKQQRKRNRPR